MAPKLSTISGFDIYRIIFSVTVALLLVGCSRTSSEGPNSSTAQSAAATPDKDHQRCFACDGKGIMACKAGCVAGQAECPGPCLRLSRGKWGTGRSNGFGNIQYVTKPAAAPMMSRPTAVQAALADRLRRTEMRKAQFE